MIDVVQQINAVQRVVGNKTLEAGEARVVTVSPCGEDRVGSFLSSRLRAYCASS